MTNTLGNTAKYAFLHKMNYLVLIFLSSFPIIHVIGHAKSTMNHGTINFGNNSGNIVNGGLVAYDSASIYFVNLDTSAAGLYSMKFDGSDLKMLAYSPIAYLSVNDGWIFFSRPTGNEATAGIFKIRTDGSGEQRISKDNGAYINVVGNWIYYIDWSREANICKMKIDGSERQILYKGNFECLTSDGHWLFFKKIGLDSGLLRGSIDGEGIKKLISDKVWKPMAFGNQIVFRDDSKKHKIYSITSDGLNVRRIINDNEDYDDYIIENGWIYLSDGLILKRQRLKGNASQIIFKGNIMEIGAAKNYVFFRCSLPDKQGDLHDRTYLRKLKN
jgi:hypothetical protein